MIAIWVVLSAVVDPLYYFVVGPHVPPGTMTSAASGAQFDFNVLFIIALPVILAVWVYLGYAIVHVARLASGGDREPDGRAVAHAATSASRSAGSSPPP